MTDSQTLGEEIDVIEYQYNDANHPNAVTTYDGTDSIVYDANGNPNSNQ